MNQMPGVKPDLCFTLGRLEISHSPMAALNNQLVKPRPGSNAESSKGRFQPMAFGGTMLA